LGGQSSRESLICQTILSRRQRGLSVKLFGYLLFSEIADQNAFTPFVTE